MVLVGASRFVGRVGGLAVALGAGAVWFSVGVAHADAGSDSATTSSDSARTVQAANGAEPSRPTSSLRSSRSDAAPRAAQVAKASGAHRHSRPSLSVARREPVAVASTGTQAAAQASSSVADAISVDPSVTWGGTFKGRAYDGMLVGTLGATSSQKLNYELVSAPSLGGKLAAVSSKKPSDTVFSAAGEFFYLPDAGALTTPGKTETFRIRVTEQTDFDTFLASIPLVGLIAPTVVSLLQQAPLLGNLLAPIIGATQVVAITVAPNELAADRPTAFTTKVESFDGLMISTNYFPATKVAQGAESAPTVLFGPGLGSPGVTDAANPYGQLNLLPDNLAPAPTPDQFGSLAPGLPVLRDGAWVSADGGEEYSYTASTGFNVITWDPRGEFATRDRSLPGLQIDAPLFEARDVSAIISWATSSANPAQLQVVTEGGDPLLGMTGGSYGGGIQWTTAATDSRIDAIIPQISWNSLISSLYPNENQFKTGFGTVLLLALMTTGAHINAQIYQGVGTGVALGWLSQTSQAVLTSSGPASLVSSIVVPTLIFQGMEDVLFPLAESVVNAQTLLTAGNEATKMVWFCGGHGTCTNPLNPYQDDLGLVDNLKWLDQYVAGNPGATDDIATFQWYDQKGFYYTSGKLPFQPGFNLADPYTETGAGGLLGLGPIIGGSGPGGVPGVSPVLTIGNAAPAWNAINMTVTPPADSQIVGAPTLTFAYSGLGSSRTVYAQLIDNETNQVLGNLVTPVPVVLDGRERTASIALADIGYTAQNAGLTLQITSSASNFENFTTVGVINIGDITLDLPIHDQSV